MGYRAAVRQVRCIGIGLLLGLLLACQVEDRPAPGDPVLQILRRLDASEFALPSSFHGAVAPIGESPARG